MSDLSPPEAPAAEPPTVSPREREVLEWLARGDTPDEIARRLRRRPKMVEQRIKTMLARLGAADATEALARLAPAVEASATEADAAADTAEPVQA